MAAPHANRPRPATLAVSVVVGVALAWLLHRVVPVTAGGPIGELQHLAVAPLLALTALVGITRLRRGTDRAVPGGRAMLAVLLLGAVGHEALAVAEELVVHGAGGALEHLAHLAPPAFALLVPAALAAAGLSCVLALAAGRLAAPGTGPVGTPVVPRPRGTTSSGTRSQLLLAGRSAGRAPPRLLRA